MKKLFEILSYLSVALLIICGAFGVVYEYLIWDKSQIHDGLFYTALALGLISLVYIILYANREKIFKLRSRKDTE